MRLHITFGISDTITVRPVFSSFGTRSADLIPLIESYGLSSHLYVDDTQVYGTCAPADVIAGLHHCGLDKSKQNRLQLNPDKSRQNWSL